MRSYQTRVTKFKRTQRARGSRPGKKIPGAQFKSPATVTTESFNGFSSEHEISEEDVAEKEMEKEMGKKMETVMNKGVEKRDDEAEESDGDRRSVCLTKCRPVRGCRRRKRTLTILRQHDHSDSGLHAISGVSSQQSCEMSCCTRTMYAYFLIAFNLLPGA